MAYEEKLLEERKVRKMVWAPFTEGAPSFSVYAVRLSEGQVTVTELQPRRSESQRPRAKGCCICLEEEPATWSRNESLLKTLFKDL